MPPQPLFVAAGEMGLRLVSTDGTEWKERQTGKEGEVYRAACFGKGRAVVLGTYGGDNIYATTLDGAKWQVSHQKGGENGLPRGLCFGKDIFVAVGGDAGFGNYARPCVAQSTDGITWSAVRPFPGKAILRRLAFGNDRFVGVGDSGRCAASQDGWKWEDAPDTRIVNTMVDIAFGNGVFVGVGLHGLRMRTENGLKWTDRQLAEEGEHLNSIVWAGDRFVAVGPKVTCTSSDGATWQRHPVKNGPLTATFGGGVFVGARWRGRLLRSTDAVAWREVHKSDYHVEAVAHGNIGLEG